MPRGTVSNASDFHLLLDWINESERENAEVSPVDTGGASGDKSLEVPSARTAEVSPDKSGEVYEDIRYRLMKFFQSRGCHNTDELADDTIERVTKKIHKIIESYEGKPLNYFYGVARNVVREQRRKPKHQELPVQLESSTGETARRKEERDQCLAHCLERLEKPEKRFILEYYFGEKAEKIENRLRLREEFGLNKQSIGVKAFRIRERLQRCVSACLKSGQ